MIRSSFLPVLPLVAFLAAPAPAQSTLRVNVSTSGAPADSFSRYPSISAGGRYVVFSSNAGLVAGDTNGEPDVFRHDRFTFETVRVNVSSSGAEAAGASANGTQAISADGRLVVFQSLARNLVPGDTNGVGDVFLRDVESGVTTRISVDSAGVQADAESFYPAISEDGRYVAFSSEASSLVAADTNGADDVFVRDLQTGLVTIASVDSSGRKGNADSYAPSLSADGRYVAFYSEADDLVPGDTNQKEDVFVHDNLTGSTVLVSVGVGGQPANAYSSWPMISADGKWVAFVSIASNLVASDLNGVEDVFVRDLAAGTTALASVSTAGDQADRATYYPPSISATGRYVAFNTPSFFLVVPDQNNFDDVYLRDVQAGVTTRESVDSAGQQGNHDSYSTAISADGRFVVFRSSSTNLIPGDANGFSDVFVHDRGSAQAVTFCGSDVAANACPCSNRGQEARGCQNSGATGGAWITDFGTASLSSDTLVLVAGGVLPGRRTMLLQGDAQTPSRAYGDGILCLGASVRRLYARTSTAGGAAASPGAGEPSISARSAALGDAIPAGTTRYYQLYYRDPDGTFCGAPLGDEWNATSGRAIAWAP